jgi:hypothetical protein
MDMPRDVGEETLLLRVVEEAEQRARLAVVILVFTMVERCTAPAANAGSFTLASCANSPKRFGS